MEGYAVENTTRTSITSSKELGHRNTPATHMRIKLTLMHFLLSFTSLHLCHPLNVVA